MSRTAGRPGIEQAWRHIYDRTYRLDQDPVTSRFDTSGWVNTYTAKPYGRAEMEEWVDETVGRILEHGPRKVLEIGCGTGLLGHRLIPEVEAYCGLDFSVAALQRFGLGLDPATRSTVCLLLGSAKDLDRVPKWDYDCIVLNSVLQYLSDTVHVEDVLRQAVALLRSPGTLFLGDLRHRDLLADHHAWREWRNGPDDMTAGYARDSAARRHGTDREWSITPGDLSGLLRSAGAEHVECRPKDGTHPTEMNLFRYDAIGYFHRAPQIIRPAEWLSWEPGTERRIDWRARRSLGILGLPNVRLVPPATAARSLREAPADTTVGELRAAAHPRENDDPMTVLRRLAAEHGAVVRTSWARDRSGHTLDLALIFQEEIHGPGPLLVQWPPTGNGTPV